MTWRGSGVSRTGKSYSMRGTVLCENVLGDRVDEHCPRATGGDVEWYVDKT